MTGSSIMEPMPMSPRQSSAGLWNAVVAFIRTRRGRMLAFSAVFMVCILGLLGARNSETITSSYHTISENYHLPSWRPHLPNLPSIISSPLKPSNTTLELENGDIKHPPVGLNKATPNFHLLMPAREDDAEFCKTTLSAMILNYPPPSTIGLYSDEGTQLDKEKMRLQRTLDHLKNKKLVKDEDLVLIVDGHDTWFQLPSDVVIRQYQNILADANKRLMEKYGFNGDGSQRYNQTVLFGAEKTCKGEDLACKYVPESLLPVDIYGSKTDRETVFARAKYLDAGMIMGPAKDLRFLYEAAVKNLEGRHSSAGTVQSVFAAMFGEQQLSRDSAAKELKKVKTTTSKFLNWFGGPVETTEEEQTANVTLPADLQYEFSIGLDYAHILFQPLHYAADDELVALPHDNSTDLTVYHHDGTPTPFLTMPAALLKARPPFWTLDLSKHDPQPKNMKPADIEPLQYQKDIDGDLEPRDTPWASVALIQNTYTGSVPSILHLNDPLATKQSRRNLNPRAAKITWTDLWYAPHSRALLRNYLRTPQSPLGFHNAAVGGDNMWDMRGGRGGIWTVDEGLWLPWGEVDGVCGTLTQLKQVFEDDKGVWLHEKEKDAEQNRLNEEEELRKKIREQKEKEEEREKKAKEEQEKKEKEEQEKKKGDHGAGKTNGRKVKRGLDRIVVLSETGRPGRERYMGKIPI